MSNTRRYAPIARDDRSEPPPLGSGPGQREGAKVVEDDDDTLEPDSATARRILDACIEKLDQNDFGIIVQMLEDKGLLGREEARAVMTARNPKRDDDDVAMDRSFAACYPNAARVQVLPGGMAEDMARHRPARVTAEQERSFYQRFPGARRIGVL